MKTEKQIISEHMAKLSKKRHAKLSKKERSEMGKKMIEARWSKYREEHKK